MQTDLVGDLAISWIDLSIIGVYIVAMLGVGYYIYRQAPSFEEYLVAGRSMTTPILICSLASTYYGLDVLFGTSEVGYNDGIVAFFGYSELSIAFYVLAAFLLSKKLHREKFISLPEILEHNYGIGAGLCGALASIFYSIPALPLFGQIGRAHV